MMDTTAFKKSGLCLLRWYEEPAASVLEESRALLEPDVGVVEVRDGGGVDDDLTQLDGLIPFGRRP